MEPVNHSERKGRTLKMYLKYFSPPSIKKKKKGNLNLSGLEIPQKVHNVCTFYGHKANNK